MKNALFLLLLGSVITTSLCGASKTLSTDESGACPMIIETKQESPAFTSIDTEQEALALPREIVILSLHFCDP